MMDVKRCSRCGEIKDISEFGKLKTNKDGLKDICKSCTYGLAKERSKKYIEMRANQKEITLKRCSKCGELKDINEFHKNPIIKDGFQSSCKSCEAKRAKESNEKRYFYFWRLPWATGEKIIGMKKCSACGELKDKSEFHKNCTTKDGLQHRCKVCISQTKKEHYKKYPEIYRKKDKELMEKRPYYKWAESSLSQHRRRGIKIEISVKELEIMGANTNFCPLCGCELILNQGNGHGSKMNSPSLDRRNNENFITKENVWVICNQCNITKGIRTVKGLIDYCKHIVSIENEIKEIIHEGI